MRKKHEEILNNVKLLEKQSKILIKDYSKFGWSDVRPKEIKEEIIEHQDKMFELLERRNTTKPKQKKIPSNFKLNYQKWYSSCCAIIEMNYNKERITEFKSMYEKNIKDIISSKYITKEEGFEIIDSIQNQTSILQALPDYVEHKIPDIELTIASNLMDDELLEAEYLLKNGFIRASGGLAGVVLERHLKMRCERNEPVIKYPIKAGIGKINELLKSNDSIDIVEWRKIQYLGDIRNKCDHDSKSEPGKDEVSDLIIKVKEMIHYY